jgi:hypothetical protein
VYGTGGLLATIAPTSNKANGSEAEHYPLARNKWFRANEVDSSKMARVNLEPLTDAEPTDPIKGFSVAPAIDADRNP